MSSPAKTIKLLFSMLIMLIMFYISNASNKFTTIDNSMHRTYTDPVEAEAAADALEAEFNDLE